MKQTGSFHIGRYGHAPPEKYSRLGHPTATAEELLHDFKLYNHSYIQGKYGIKMNDTSDRVDILKAYVVFKKKTENVTFEEMMEHYKLNAKKLIPPTNFFGVNSELAHQCFPPTIMTKLRTRLLQTRHDTPKAPNNIIFYQAASDSISEVRPLLSNLLIALADDHQVDESQLMNVRELMDTSLSIAQSLLGMQQHRLPRFPIDLRCDHCPHLQQFHPTMAYNTYRVGNQEDGEEDFQVYSIALGVCCPLFKQGNFDHSPVQDTSLGTGDLFKEEHTVVPPFVAAHMPTETRAILMQCARRLNSTGVARNYNSCINHRSLTVRHAICSLLDNYGFAPTHAVLASIDDESKNKVCKDYHGPTLKNLIAEIHHEHFLALETHFEDTPIIKQWAGYLIKPAVPGRAEPDADPDTDEENN